MVQRPRFVVLRLMIATLIIAGMLLNGSLPTRASDTSPTAGAREVNQSANVVIRLYYADQANLNAVAGRLDIWEVHPTIRVGYGPGYVVAEVTPTQQAWLESLGYKVEIDTEKTALVQGPQAVLDPQYYYFDDYNQNVNDRYMVNFLQDTQAAYPGITELLDVGDAWGGLNGQHARDMWIMRISNEDTQYGNIADKPVFFMIANIHAREDTTPEMAIRYIKYLTTGYRDQGGYGLDPDVTWLVNHHATYVMVTINPDGHAVNEGDTNINYWGWRKNIDSDNGCSDPYSWGTDINRNSSFFWSLGGGSSGYPCDETYRGPAAVSEPETQAFQDFTATIFQDWNGNNADDEIVAAPDNASGIFITLHSYADEILWPFGFDPGGAPNNAQLQTIGRKLGLITTSMDPSGYVGYPVDGSSDDWIYGHLGIAGFTYEIGPDYGTCGGFHPVYGCQDGTSGAPRDFWSEMGPSFVYANKIAATPYITAYGPDAQDLLVTPALVFPGQPVDLTGTVLDQRLGSDPEVPIAAAEYFIDAPGADGTGTALAPVDGDWGQTSEDVTASVDTTTLAEGQHYILIHGKNVNGVWGPYTAVFLTIAQYDFTLSPDTASAGGYLGQQVDYTLHITNTGNVEDTYDILSTGVWTVTAPTTVGPLAAGDGADLTVSVDIPPTVEPGDFDVASIEATSQGESGLSETSVLTTTALQAGPVVDPTSAEGLGYPGMPVTYTVQLSNHNYVADTFSLTALSAWQADYPQEVGPIGPDGSTMVDLVINIPSNAATGVSDTAIFTFTSSIPDLPVATLTITTTVNPAYGFEAVPDMTSQVVYGRGTSAIYTVAITNTGNLTDTYTITPTGNLWPVEVAPVLGPLQKGETSSLTVTVTVPADIDLPASDEVTLTFTSRGSGITQSVKLQTDALLSITYMPFTQKQ